ncbi:hypothetical protein VAE151_550493 [Vibrio aestuarianus]|uniref:Uncharacterized protein n=1 Tax=Vibrio aestuarianus TaxID=28171 RepID=A0ABN8TRM0_9VIBR|nr:hypothetical protein VAE308_1050497 [Vibrio aestuarianus]CAH8196994.1 hypothetical protein VIBAE_A31090 [Vibrio aestuarianus subsp. francensis]CAH8197353.1 hypothetical protein VAE055_370493 [Vibrio aestuarianus]CAH8197459.1 hypothetical protein VAE032_270495 [Vibrio aestuarianus]CAH8197558.1 hypothetical protein VAE128_460497 [Vibrio aestuarianus]
MVIACGFSHLGHYNTEHIYINASRKSRINQESSWKTLKS